MYVSFWIIEADLVTISSVNILIECYMPVDLSIVISPATCGCTVLPNAELIWRTAFELSHT